MSACSKCNKWNPFSLLLGSSKSRSKTARKKYKKMRYTQSMRGGYRPKLSKPSYRTKA